MVYFILLKSKQPIALLLIGPIKLQKKVLYLGVNFFIFYFLNSQVENDQKRLSRVVGCFFVVTVSSALSFGEK